jgi:hypothetical protein
MINGRVRVRLVEYSVDVGLILLNEALIPVIKRAIVRLSADGVTISLTMYGEQNDPFPNIIVYGPDCGIRCPGSMGGRSSSWIGFPRFVFVGRGFGSEMCMWGFDGLDGVSSMVLASPAYEYDTSSGTYRAVMMAYDTSSGTYRAVMMADVQR